jgi:hypothetical protein
VEEEEEMRQPRWRFYLFYFSISGSECSSIHVAGTITLPPSCLAPLPRYFIIIIFVLYQVHAPPVVFSLLSMYTKLVSGFCMYLY